jgi:hypothetical protein
MNTIVIWLTIGMFGLIFVPCAIACLILGTDTKHKIWGAIICLLFWVLFSGAIIGQMYVDDGAWNDGHCDCGGKWELRAVSESRMGTKTKYYACENCGKEITQSA